MQHGATLASHGRSIGDLVDAVGRLMLGLDLSRF
jgi:hypothetical protein